MRESATASTLDAPPVVERIRQMLMSLRPKKARAQPADGLDRLDKLRDERARLSRLVDAEGERLRALGEQLRKTDAARIEALTASRLNDDDAARRRADELSTEAANLRRDIEESTAVVQSIKTRLEAARSEFAGAMRSYAFAVASHLDGLYQALIERYNDLAPELAETVLHIAAVRRVMMANGIANTNGWSGEVLLPGMAAREGAYIRPILDGATAEFSAAADERAAAVMKELEAAGFKYGSGGTR